MLVHVHRPRPRHINLLKDSSQLVLMLSCRSCLLPEKGPLDVPKGTPAPALLGPETTFAVSASLDKLVELTIADHELSSLKGRHVNFAVAVFVVPTKCREILLLANAHSCFALNRDELVLGKINTLARVKRGSVSGKCCFMKPWPVFRLTNKVHGQFTHEHRGGFKVNTIMLEVHEECPKLVIGGDLDRVSVCGEVLIDNLVDHVECLATVFVNFTDCRPLHGIFRHVIPAHFVHANLENILKVAVNPMGNKACYVQFVGVKCHRVTVVENHGMT
mmetsp:Transcript_10659/g.20975  ORF Transcript_10659/g.20975 Transcript_10659/m.20975 type:complete len:275 (-) Transcript_10659:885-1709(-)